MLCVVFEILAVVMCFVVPSLWILYLSNFLKRWRTLLNTIHPSFKLSNIANIELVDLYIQKSKDITKWIVLISLTTLLSGFLSITLFDVYPIPQIFEFLYFINILCIFIHVNTIIKIEKIKGLLE